MTVSFTPIYQFLPTQLFTVLIVDATIPTAAGIENNCCYSQLKCSLGKKSRFIVTICLANW